MTSTPKPRLTPETIDTMARYLDNNGCPGEAYAIRQLRADLAAANAAVRDVWPRDSVWHWRHYDAIERALAEATHD
jgi:hypothetical protein